jgi:hypothetical protein
MAHKSECVRSRSRTSQCSLLAHKPSMRRKTQSFKTGLDSPLVGRSRGCLLALTDSGEEFPGNGTGVKPSLIESREETSLRPRDIEEGGRAGLIEEFGSRLFEEVDEIPFRPELEVLEEK